MSRYTTTHYNGNEVAYGLDHAFGWFYQEFGDDRETLVKDLDSLTTDLRGYQLTELLEKTNAPADHIRNPSLDLDPGVYDDLT